MSDPKPWLQDGAPDGWRALLEAARDDGPSAAQLARLRAKVVSGPPGGSGGGAPGGASVPRGLWVGGAAVGVVMAVAAFQLGRSVESPAPAAVVPVAPAPVVVPTSPAPVVAPSSAPPSVAPAPAVPAVMPALPKPPLRALPKTVAPAPPEADLGELELLQQAMTAIQSKDFSGGRALLDRHAQRFPRSDLEQEREVLRIEALVGLGALEEARGLAEAFNQRWPTSTHRLRVEALVK
ncbi:MAG: hypothetical protein K1X89_05985 [Myxococcaceae bacterium]|nr:hypothetical protein [Myxococcaceae bacterium]